MDDKRLEDIYQRARAATKGPWLLDEQTTPQRRQVSSKPAGYVSVCVLESHFRHDPRLVIDGEFIAHAREDVIELVAEVRRLRAALAGQEVK